MVQNRVLWLFIILTVSCHSKDCSFENSFLANNAVTKPDLIIISDKENCSELLLTGNFNYHINNHKLEKKLIKKDSVFVFKQNEKKILFDFSYKKRTGTLQVNDSLNLHINFFIDLISKQQKFRLFKIDNIGKYYSLNLSKIYITNINYGIVGELIVGYENKQWFLFNEKGYIPDEEYINSIFERAKLE